MSAQTKHKQIKIFENSDVYDNYVVDMDRLYYRKITDRVQKFSQAPKNRLLDIGCFDGTFAATFLKDWSQVYGVEGNPGACEAARSKGIRISQVGLDQPLPFPDGHFDCVIGAEVIEHVFDTDFFLAEIYRVLAPGGLLVMSIPNIASLTNRIKLLLGQYPRYAEYIANTAGGHIRIYTASVLRDQVKNNGFSILDLAGCNLPLPMHATWLPKWLKALADKGGDHWPGIAGQVILAARKTD